MMVLLTSLSWGLVCWAVPQRHLQRKHLQKKHLQKKHLQRRHLQKKHLQKRQQSDQFRRLCQAGIDLKSMLCDADPV